MKILEGKEISAEEKTIESPRIVINSADRSAMAWLSVGPLAL